MERKYPTRKKMAVTQKSPKRVSKKALIKTDRIFFRDEKLPKRKRKQKPVTVKELVDALNSEVKPCKTEHDNRINMGMGKLGNIHIDISRMFRWTMENDKLPPDFFRKVSINYKAKRIDFEYYDVVDSVEGMHALLWALGLEEEPNDKLKFTTYNGCGCKLYSCEFSNLRLLDHESQFDYAISDPACQKISVGYGKVDVQLAFNKVQLDPEKEKNV